MIIGHVRLKSCGIQSHENTHPFEINNWVFAHNGTVSSIMSMEEFKLKRFKPIGKTDSEFAFCYLLERLEDERNPKIVEDILKKEAHNIKTKSGGRFNFILSDGEYLYAYGDDSLYYVERKFPFNSIVLKDDEYEVDLKDIKDPKEEVIIIATEPLTINEYWKRIIGLKIFKDGKEVVLNYE